MNGVIQLTNEMLNKLLGLVEVEYESLTEFAAHATVESMKGVQEDLALLGDLRQKLTEMLKP